MEWPRESLIKTAVLAVLVAASAVPGQFLKNHLGDKDAW